MRPALVALLPMLAAASLMLVGGERLAREKVENRIPADRERLLDFAGKFGSELERLDQRYKSHLNRVSSGFVAGKNVDLITEGRSIHGILAIHHLTLGQNPNVYPLNSPGPNAPRLPEIVVEGRDKPLDPDNSVTIPKDLLDVLAIGNDGWLPAPNPDHRVFWTRPDGVHLVAFVIDQKKVRKITNSHLASWIENPLTPLRESKSIYAIRSTDRELASPDQEHQGSAALIMPFRTDLGDWQVQAWDRVTTSTSHDTATLAAAGAIAAVLALGGVLLWLQQRRALQLAEERVSFVNRVSHELGTPLTNVALNVDLATESLEAQPKEARKRLGIVTEEIERLGRLVANVLTFSRRERHTLNLDPQPCTPDEIISQTINSFRPALKRRDIEVKWTPNAATRTLLDPDAFGQIVGNLISNVEKYAADGHWLHIESQLTKEQLRVRVTDHGPGIPAASRDKVFDAFERVHRVINEGASGTGLGLTIARELATRMGGSLTLIPTDKGTCFELQLPAPENLKVVPHVKSSAA